MQKLKVLLIGFLAVGFLWACESNDRVPNGMSRLQVYLVDAPGAYEEVNVEIIDVLINPEEGDNGWQSLGMIQPGVYNLLDFTGGIDTLLADTELPAGEIRQIRLLLGNDNYLVIDGNQVDLTTPSAQQSGLKINLHATLEEGILYRVYLDFDAGRSVVRAGNSGNFILKPVIRATLASQGGTIRGRVSPEDVQTRVFAIQNGDSVSTFTNEEGHYMMRGLNPGLYTVSIFPEEPYEGVVLEGIEVEDNQVTDLGLTTLNNPEATE